MMRSRCRNPRFHTVAGGLLGVAIGFAAAGCSDKSADSAAHNGSDELKLPVADGSADDPASVSMDNDLMARIPPPGQRRVIPLEATLKSIFESIQRGETGRSRLALTSYMNTHPQDGQAVFLNGLTYHREKSYALARKHFDRAIEMAPEYYATYYFNGWAAYYLGQLSEARNLFLANLAFQPDNGDTHFALGLIALDLNETDEARMRFEKAIALHTGQPRRQPELAKARARLGEMLAMQGELDRAPEELEAATTLNPRAYEAWYQLSRVLTRLGDDEGAAHALKRHDEEERRFNTPPERPAGPPKPPNRN
ncbi:MAG: tetratricopeptide repeat protein [Phycisphaerales bacterium]|nr:tetratricopeptide repeat protein [Phycisphaerales bacterium]